MPDQYAIYIGTAFIAGVGLALVCKDVLYPQPSQEKSTPQEAPSDALVARPGPPAIIDGIEGCIGNTPLFRIKSLSDATGCEILGKAEVCNPRLTCEGNVLMTM
jgi:cysteine synthase A